MGKDFKEKVYQAMKEIPPGKVTTYKEIAGYLNSRAYRAVGRAAALNPYAPEVPCHRVVKSCGNIGGYSGPGGIKRKAELLRKEGVEVKQGRIVNFKKVLYKL